MIRIFLACLAARLSRAALHLLGRGGTTYPGKIALKICPDILRRLSSGVDTVLVTGTNGKTTTVKMLCGALESLGTPVLTNRAGANLAAGITAEFLYNADLLGRPRLRHAVIESDEAALKQVSGSLRPRAILVTNLFRDQLDRYGEVTHTLAEIREGVLRAPEAVLCLNADCSLTASLGSDCPNKTVYYGVNVPSGEAPAVSDAPRCLRCGTGYEYRYQTFAHLGGFYCPHCGYQRPTPDLAVTVVTALPEGRSDIRFTWQGREIEAQVALPSLYNVYNAAAALAAVGAVGGDVETASASLSHIQAGFGRMETMTVDETPVRVILVKNPAGCDRALEYLATVPSPWRAVFCLNDKLNDGTDISWVWDADYERFAASAAPERLYVYGLRAEDMRLRLKYAGVADEDITVLHSLDELLEAVKASAVPVYVLPNYTSMLEVRDHLAKASGGRSFWE